MYARRLKTDKRVHFLSGDAIAGREINFFPLFFLPPLTIVLARLMYETNQDPSDAARESEPQDTEAAEGLSGGGAGKKKRKVEVEEAAETQSVPSAPRPGEFGLGRASAALRVSALRRPRSLHVCQPHSDHACQGSDHALKSRQT